ncbi:MAG: metal ABC transporter substrate-binding protein [Ilumatobacteraceae bacterium]
MEAGATPSSTVPAAPVIVAGASIPPLADLVSRVGGPRVEVISVVPQGVDGHTYEPNPSDVADLTRTGIMFFASENLNPSVTRTARASLPATALQVDLMDLTVPESEVIADRTHSHGPDGSHSHANVHVWTDPTIALRWVSAIRDRLTQLDPAGAELYFANAEALSGKIQALHDAIIAATATVPEAFRTLVVYHDSWSYFGRTYGYRVLGALQAADFAEPSAAEMRNMIEQVRSAGVPAFFGAAVFPTEVLKRVSDEAGVPYVADLADDELPGEPGEPRHSYLGMMIDNVRHIITSLGGDVSVLNGLQP